MFLSDLEIKKLVEEFPDFIQPFTPHKVLDVVGGKVPSWGLEPHGYTFRLSPRILYYPPSFSLLTFFRTDVGKPPDPELIEMEGEDEFLHLPPYGMLLCSSMEVFNLPNNIVGLLVGKSTYTRRGLCYNMTVVDAGYSGQIHFTVVNLNPIQAIEVYPYGGIAQILFVPCGGAEVPYIPSTVYKPSASEREVEGGG